MNHIRTINYVAPLVFLFALPWLAQSPYAHHLLIMSGIAIVLGVSNRLILVSGAWFMGHAAFYAIGAYGLVLLRTKLGVSFWLALPAIGFVAAVVALGLGYATSRVRGIPFCIISVAFVEVVRLTIIKIDFLGGHRALKCGPPDPIFGITFSSKIHYYYLILFIAAASIFLLHLIEKSRVGSILKTIAENESLAESLGINTVRYRVVTLAICAFFGGIAGGFYAPYVAVTGPTSFTLVTSTVILFYIVVGGFSSIWGPVVGALFLNFLPEVLPSRASTQNILYAATVLAALFFLPNGIIGLPKTISTRFFSRTSRVKDNEQSHA
jgi:branched-chain amino acid transport system permease protein